MQIGMIAGMTRTIGKKQGYLGLPLRDIIVNDKVNGPETPAMETAWLPTPQELINLQLGAPVILRVLGSGHPPVLVYVGDVPSDDASVATAAVELMKSQLLIVLVRMLGGKVNATADEIDATGAFELTMKVEGRTFYFEVNPKGHQAPADDGVDPRTQELMKPRGNGGFVSIEVCVSALCLVGDVPHFTELEPIVEALTQEQRDRAYDWAVRVHLHASDNDDVYVPARPAFIPGRGK